MTTMKVTAVTPCECPAHGMVQLRDEVGIERLELRIEIAAAQSIAAQLHGICGPDSCHSELLDLCLSSQGSKLDGVMLTEKPGGTHEAHLCIDGVRATRVRVPLATALVVASKLELPIWLRERRPGPSQLPAAFLDAFSEPGPNW
jgi:bifunctional DNase/RNase